MKKTIQLKFLASLCVVFLFTLNLQGEKAAIDPDTIENKVDQIFARWEKTDSPGCSLAIIKQGQIVYQRGYGMAHLDRNIPITPETVFDIGSVSKQFTAAAVVLLSLKGELSLDDDIRDYFPDFPDYGTPVTIRHLINNISGIRDYTWLMLLARWSFDDNSKERDQEILGLIKRQKGIQFPPGEAYFYSNSNWLLLALIVERVTGMSLGEFARKNLFEPLGMQSTFIHDNQVKLPEELALGYVQEGQSRYGNRKRGIIKGAGGVNSTVQDLYLWSRNFSNNKVGGPDFVSIMTTPGKLNNGKPLDYACGLELGEYRGSKTIGHQGFTGSFISYMVRFPEHDFEVICLANLGNMHPRTLSMKVTDLYLADRLDPIKSAPAAVDPVERTVVRVNPTIYDSYVGDYRFDFGLVMQISKNDDRLMMKAGQQPKVELFPESKNKFFLKAADIQLIFDKDGEKGASGFTFVQKGNSMQAKRIEGTEQLSSDTLAAITGPYYSDELQVTYTVVLEGDQLFIRAPRLDENLRHVKGNAFAYSKGDVVFLRNIEDRVASFKLEIKSERLSFRFAKTISSHP